MCLYSTNKAVMVSVKGQAMPQIQPSKTRSDKVDNNSTTVQKSDRPTLKAAKAGKVGLAFAGITSATHAGERASGKEGRAV